MNFYAVKWFLKYKGLPITAKKFKENVYKRGFWLEFNEVQQNGKKYALHANVDTVDGNPVSVKVKNSTNHNLTKVERMI